MRAGCGDCAVRDEQEHAGRGGGVVLRGGLDWDTASGLRGVWRGRADVCGRGVSAAFADEYCAIHLRDAVEERGDAGGMLDGYTGFGEGVWFPHDRHVAGRAAVYV